MQPDMFSSTSRPIPKRIHVVGGPGSGKTTLARRLAALLNAPAYDLDAIGFEGGAGPARSLETRLSDVEAIRQQQGWITEGIYLGWTDPLFEAADCIVWLDLPWPVAAWRVVLRHTKRSMAGNNPHRGLLKLFRFTRWMVQDYYRPSTSLPPAPNTDTVATRTATAQALMAYQTKVIHLRTAPMVARWTQSLATLIASPPISRPN